MDSYFRGTLWMILILFPHLACNTVCPKFCMCVPNAIRCVGHTITDVPKQLPVNTSLLMLENTNIHVLNEQSLAEKDLLLRFSLTHSPLRTIHPRAFVVATQFMSVKLSSNNLSTLPDGVFSPMTNLQQLHLDFNTLETIAPRMFEGLVELFDLNLSWNKLSSLASDVFDGLHNLNSLNLGRNSIKKLTPTIFHSLTKLEQLLLYNNKLEVLEPGIFDGLVNLQELKLHQNHITSIPPQVFWSLTNLKILTMSSNHLTAIPEKSFYNMPKLTKLTIYNNPLLSLPDQLIGHTPDIRNFYLYATNLTTVPGNLFANMSGLESLNFHLNEWLDELPPDLFCCLPNLHKLSLKANKLLYLHPQHFSRLTTLGILLLNDNKLQSLPDNIFQGLGELVTIDLKNNHLKTLPGDIFLTNTALRALNMSVNPWDCTCDIIGIAKWLRHNERVVIDRNKVLCNSPERQRLRTIGSLSEEEMVCDATTVTTYFPTQTETPLFHYTSPPFHDTLVVEQGPEFVHNNLYKGWVYVWFLPSEIALAGLLMFFHILFVATGLFLILAAMYVMYRLNKTMNELKAE